MKTIAVTRTIEAPLELVFQTVSDVRNFRKAVPHILNIDFLTEQQHGVGTRFRETRLMNKREATCELEVTEYVENDRVRMVSDAGGTIWDSVFTVAQKDDHVELRMEMEARPHTLFAKVITPLIRGMVVKGVSADMDSVKVYCEENSNQE